MQISDNHPGITIKKKKKAEHDYNNNKKNIIKNIKNTP